MLPIMDISDAKKLARELMDQHGLSHWSLRFDNARRRYGVCRHRRQEIGLSKMLVGMNEEPSVKDTILHEVAHALCPIWEHHGPAWRAKAVEVGCNPNRCYDGAAVATPEKPWLGTCPNGHEVSRFRRPRGEASCNKCGGGRFNREYLVTWKRR
jgi:predicted SprT family Zn-dependent metalloprotease